jgi:polyisoprenoid-binding protein YceI
MNNTVDKAPSTSSSHTVPGVAPFAVPAAAATYDIDSSHSSATFKVRHMMVANVRGELGQIAGRVVLDESDVTRSSVEATIDASTINTRDAKRDEHLRSADFLDVAGHPLITFKSTRVQSGKGGGLFVTGDLTIRGTTREVTLDLETPSPEVRDPWGNLKRGVAARARINRKDFGVTWNVALEAGGILVGDEISINLEIELGRKADATA